MENNHKKDTDVELKWCEFMLLFLFIIIIMPFLLFFVCMYMGFRMVYNDEPEIERKLKNFINELFTK